MKDSRRQRMGRPARQVSGNRYPGIPRVRRWKRGKNCWKRLRRITREWQGTRATNCRKRRRRGSEKDNAETQRPQRFAEKRKQGQPCNVRQIPGSGDKKLRSHANRKKGTMYRAPTREDLKKEIVEERLQKIIARAGIASRRHAELLIASGQVRVNGRVVKELGTKADASKDRIEAAGKVVEANPGRRVYIVLNKPPEVVSAMADPEGRKTLRNCLRGLPERVFPVGNLEYAASGLVFLTNDGDLAAEMLDKWAQLEQVYQVKVKGMLTLADLERLGKEIGVKMQTVRQPDATRGRAANYWYEVRMRDSKKEELRRVLFKEKHPLEKLKRIGLGPLTLEGIPRGRYRMIEQKEAEKLKKFEVAGNGVSVKMKKEKKRI